MVNRRYILGLMLLVYVLVGCGSQPAPASPAPTPVVSTPGTSLFELATQEPTRVVGGSVPADTIIVRAAGPGRPFDRRLLGTNVPAWLGPELLGEPAFRERTIALGTSLLRMPGGNWSNYYDWLGCEMRDEKLCYWSGIARPSDFLAFARAVDAEVVWTVSMNGTAQEAAALVAFFNGSPTDERLIGVDARGRDWKTVGHWARLRVEQGNPEPLVVRLWEVGNELYGSKPETGGSECAPWGWEDGWTCDGAEYITGKGEGAERREGYLEFRAAMRAVDPSIQVGAVGVEDPAGWTNWGNEIIEGAGEELDFYSVHLYPFDNETPLAEQVLARPQQVWPDMMTAIKGGFARYAGGRKAPVAVTEYNIVAVQELDTNQLMNRAVNALFTADTIGQLAEQGVSIANHWNLANGKHENGTDYGMIDVKTGALSPQFYGMMIWQHFGTELLPVDTSFPADTTLSVYAGRTPAGDLTLIAINKTAQPVEARLRVDGLETALSGTIDTITAVDLNALEMRFNGMPGANRVVAPPAQPLERFEETTSQTFPPFSITLVRISPVP